MQLNPDDDRCDRIMRLFPAIAAGVSDSADPVNDIAVLASVLLSFVADHALDGRAAFLVKTAQSINHLPFTPELTAQLAHLISTFQAIAAAESARAAATSHGVES